SSSLGYLASALSSPPSGPSQRSSCSSSPSSDSSQPSSAPPPRKRCRVSSDSSPLIASPSPSPSAGPFYKRFRSPTSLASTAITPTPVVVSLLPTDLLPPRKRFRGTPSAPQEDAPVEATTEARLTHHTRLIEEIHDHLREILIARFVSIGHEIETLWARIVLAKREIMALRARYEASELRDESS
ncbi:hypothetical protein Tco_1477546, partial [Tanacetum coccineum]